MRQLNPIAWRQIDETVRVQFGRAKSIVADLRSAVEDVAAGLLAKKRLTGDEVKAMLADSGAPPRLQ